MFNFLSFLWYLKASLFSPNLHKTSLPPQGCRKAKMYKGTGVKKKKTSPVCVCFSLGIFVYFFLHTDYQTPAGLLQIPPGLLDAHLLLLSFSNARVLRELHRPSGISPTQLSTRKAACEPSRGPKAAAAPLFVLFGLRLTCLDRVEKKHVLKWIILKFMLSVAVFIFLSLDADERRCDCAL